MFFPFCIYQLRKHFSEVALDEKKYSPTIFHPDFTVKISDLILRVFQMQKCMNMTAKQRQVMVTGDRPGLKRFNSEILDIIRFVGN